MQILSWNIQATKGVDNVCSSKRIANDIEAFSNADIICLQEVMRVTDNDQVEEIAQFFPEHDIYFGAAINRLHKNGRLQFGNLILSRLPVLQAINHKLPQPAQPSAKHMPRQAIELIVPYKSMPLRIVTTHLDYFATKQRTAQVNYLFNHYLESADRFYKPSPDGGEEQFESIPETLNTIYAGDFNLNVDSSDYQLLLQETANGSLVDCWRLIHGDTPHAPTCGIFDHVQWQEGAHCRDFFFASQEIAAGIKDIEVQTDTAASDHQPVKISLE